MPLFSINSDNRIKNVSGGRVSLLEKNIGESFGHFCKGHVCIGAKRALAEHRVYFGLYDQMEGVSTALSVLKDLDQYFALTDHDPDPFRQEVLKTCALIFTGFVGDQDSFAARFWSFAQLLHDVDQLSHPWDSEVDSDPSSPHFEFCLRSRAIFTTTLNPANPRFARKFGYPAWVMNQTSQFNALRAMPSGQHTEFDSWQRKIRAADTSLDPSGTHNLILTNHGQASAATQLAGSTFPGLDFKVRESAERSTIREALAEQAKREGAGDA